MKATALLLALLLGARAAEPPGPWDALIPPVRSLYLDGRRLEAQDQLEGAAARYRRVLELEPSWTQALLDLGRVQEQLGDLAAAEATYARAPFDADAVEALAWLLLRTDRHHRAADAFRRLRDLRPDTPRFLVPEARATALADPERGAAVLREYLDRPGADPSSEDVLDTAAEIARALRQGGDDVLAAALLDDLVERLDPEVGEGSRALQAIEALRVRFAVEEEARALAAAAHEPLIPQQQVQLGEAREAFAAGRAAHAEEVLRGLLEENPRNAETWAALSDVLEARGDIAGAEQAIRMAQGLAPLVAEYPARLGDLLATHYGGRYDAEAADAYGRALQLPGAPPELWFRRGRVQQRAGAPERAIASFQRYMERAPRGPAAERARRFVEGWHRERPPPPDVPEAPGRPASVPEDAWFAYHLAYVLTHRAEGDPAGLREALAELERARRLAPGFARAVRLEAAIRMALGERDEARRLYEEALALDGAQADVLVLLAELDRAAGDVAAADARLQQAARLGSAEALFQLARADAEAWRLLAAREHLDAYFASTTSGVAYEDAVALAAEVDQRLRGIAVLGGAVGGSAVLIPLFARWRRRSGQSLEALLRASPSVWRDVARIASAIRHEVLKHNTTVLSTVADALEVRDTEPARWAAEKLFGERGALRRFQDYVEELRLLAAVHGVRLNLRYRDPVLGPVVEAMDRLAALEPDLREGGGRRLASELRELSEILNRTGYQGLGRLIRRVCLLELDEALLREIWEEVVREPAFRDGPAAELEISLPAGNPRSTPAERIAVRIFRGDLQDILVNLLRNALTASQELENPRLRLSVETEEDEITGLERVALRVADHAPRRITTAMIRGRYIGRGLGLAVDLVSRNGGSVHVEREPGFSKAVVVRLPRAELTDDEEEG